MKKISLLGAGQIGGMIAQMIVEHKLGHIELIDVQGDLAKGKALDLSQSAVIDHYPFCINGGDDFSCLIDSDVVIVSAGATRKPGMSRDDLLSINSRVMHDLGLHIQKFCKEAFVIVITNPLDIMVDLMQKTIRGNPKKIVGMAGILDTARFTFFLEETLKISPVQSIVLGGHGDFMVPLIRYTTVGGAPLQEFIDKGEISQSQLHSIIERTKNGGAEILNLFKTGSAYVAPARSALSIAKSYLLDQKQVLPCSAYLTGEYGVYNLFVGVPVVIGKNGVEDVIELLLDKDENMLFQASVSSIKKLIKE